jgi:hypothetical protein
MAPRHPEVEFAHATGRPVAKVQNGTFDLPDKIIAPPHQAVVSA